MKKEIEGMTWELGLLCALHHKRRHTPRVQLIGKCLDQPVRPVELVPSERKKKKKHDYK